MPNPTEPTEQQLRAQPSKPPPETGLGRLRRIIFERNVPNHEIRDEAIGYDDLEKIPRVEVRFFPHRRYGGSPLQLLERAGWEPGPLWSFVTQLPKKNDWKTRTALRQSFGQDPAFVFMGADGCLWIWHTSISGCHIDPFHEQNINNVWIVGYKRL